MEEIKTGGHLGPSPSPATKLLSGLGLKTRIAIVCVLVLTAGWRLAPRQAAPAALAVPEERSAPLIEERTNTRVAADLPWDARAMVSLASPFVVSVIANVARPATVGDHFWVPTSAEPLASSGVGVLVSTSGDVLTHVLALGGQSSVMVDAGGEAKMAARPVAIDLATGLVLLRSTGNTRVWTPASFASAMPMNGTAGALIRSSQGPVAVPVMASSLSGAEYFFAPLATTLPSGSPVFSLSGALLAVTGGGHLTTTFPSAQSVYDQLSSLAATGRGVPSALGLVLQPLAPGLDAAFGSAGVLVSDVVDGTPAALAGLVPGDLIKAIGSDAVTAVEQARSLIGTLPVGEAALITVERGRVERTIGVVPRSAIDVFALSAVIERPSTAGVPSAGSLWPPDVLEAAGVLPTALLLRVDGRPVTSLAAARQQLARSAPQHTVQLESQGRRFIAVIPHVP